MPSIIGRGRYARTTYPQSPGAGGAASNAPLSRQRFIDGGTAAAGPGAASAPFATIADFIASRPLGVSALDSAANYVGWLMPCLNGYVEDVSFPPYVSTELRADSLSPASIAAGGTVIDGDLTWNNAGGTAAGPTALLVLHNIPATGSLSITDDADAPDSAVIVSGDEEASGSSALSQIDCRATVKLVEIFLYNTTLALGINADNTRADAAFAICAGCNLNGSLVAKALGIVDSAINCTGLAAFELAQFERCEFQAASNPILAAPLGKFDGTSWNSFLEAGGTRGVGTVVTVEGGANGALVEGAPLSTGGLASVSVAINGSGATAGFTGEHCGNHYSTASVTQTSITLLTAGALVGDTMLITRTAVVASNLAVINGGGGAGTVGTIPTGNKGSVLARFDGTNWIFVSGGALAA